MKKTYIIPAVQVVTMHATSMLATSNRQQSIDGVSTYDDGGDISGTKGNDVGNIWGDDDE